MLIEALVVMHVAVLGYWLGSEFVINSTFRYVCFGASLPVPERKRLMDHVLDVDQHVRYALLLQWTLGFYLAFRIGYLPSYDWAGAAVVVIGAAWLGLVEITHRTRSSALGQRLAQLDRGIRYGVVGLLGILSVGALTGYFELQNWLAWKLLCFAGVMLCGLLIRFALIRLFHLFEELTALGSSPELEARLNSAYYGASSYLIVMWALIGAITLLSVWKVH
jgi:cytochrome c oxidase subunit IV